MEPGSEANDIGMYFVLGPPTPSYQHVQVKGNLEAYVCIIDSSNLVVENNITFAIVSASITG